MIELTTREYSELLSDITEMEKRSEAGILSRNDEKVLEEYKEILRNCSVHTTKEIKR